MRKALIVILLTLSAGRAALAETRVMPPWKHILPLSPGAIDLITSAVARSPTVEALLNQVEQTSVFVYITDLMPGGPTGPHSYMVYLANDADARYLLIRIDRWRSTPVERIALLGHELQHALEVVAAPEVRDAAGLAKLYRRIGWEGQKDRFETEAAQNIGSRVRGEAARSDDRKRAAAVVAARSGAAASPVTPEAAGSSASAAPSRSDIDLGEAEPDVPLPVRIRTLTFSRQ